MPRDIYAHQRAVAGCRCLSSLELERFGIVGAFNAIIDGDTYAYSASYGRDSCLAHDFETLPSCKWNPGCYGVAESLAALPDWCLHQWCYVNGSVASNKRSGRRGRRSPSPEPNEIP